MSACRVFFPRVVVQVPARGRAAGGTKRGSAGGKGSGSKSRSTSKGSRQMKQNLDEAVTEKEADKLPRDRGRQDEKNEAQEGTNNGHTASRPARRKSCN